MSGAQQIVTNAALALSELRACDPYVCWNGSFLGHVVLCYMEKAVVQEAVVLWRSHT